MYRSNSQANVKITQTIKRKSVKSWHEFRHTKQMNSLKEHSSYTQWAILQKGDLHSSSMIKVKLCSELQAFFIFLSLFDVCWESCNSASQVTHLSPLWLPTSRHLSALHVQTNTHTLIHTHRASTELWSVNTCSHVPLPPDPKGLSPHPGLPLHPGQPSPPFYKFCFTRIWNRITPCIGFT